MRISLLFVLVLSLASIACSTQGSVMPQAMPQTGHRAIVGDFEASAPITATVTAYSVYVRAEPDSASPAIASLIRGQAVEFVACESGWCELLDGGFVWQGCLSNAPTGVGCGEAK